MGWGKILSIAGGLGMDYLSKKGIDGAMEDANKLKNGVQRLFQSGDGNADDEDAQVYREDWRQTEDDIKSCISSEDYESAYNNLKGFYERHEEEPDFWYGYWWTKITEELWENLWYEELTDEKKRVVKLNKDIDSLRTEIEEKLDSLKTNAEGKDQAETVEELFDHHLNMYELQTEWLFDNKVWREIDKLLDPHKITSGSKYFDYTNAANRVNSLLYSDQHETLDYGRDLCKVYDAMLHTALQDDTLLADVKSHFKEVKQEVDRLVSVLRNVQTDDDDERQEGKRLANKISSLLGQVKGKADKPKQEQQTANAAPQGNVKNEQEYLDEVKACLADDGKISQRERRLLNRLRDSLGISEQRAKELEASLSPSLTDDEKEYVEALKESMADGVISQRERRLLEKLRASMGISEERAKELEKNIS